MCVVFGSEAFGLSCSVSALCWAMFAFKWMSIFGALLALALAGPAVAPGGGGDPPGFPGGPPKVIGLASCSF